MVKIVITTRRVRESIGMNPVVWLVHDLIWTDLDGLAEMDADKDATRRSSIKPMDCKLSVR